MLKVQERLFEAGLLPISVHPNKCFCIQHCLRLKVNTIPPWEINFAADKAVKAMVSW